MARLLVELKRDAPAPVLEPLEELMPPTLGPAVVEVVDPLMVVELSTTAVVVVDSVVVGATVLVVVVGSVVVGATVVDVVLDVVVDSVVGATVVVVVVVVGPGVSHVVTLPAKGKSWISLLLHTCEPRCSRPPT